MIKALVILAGLSINSAAFVSEPTFTDDGGHVWSLKSGQVYRDGIPDTASGRATSLSYSFGQVTKGVVDSKKFCLNARLKTSSVVWPAGDAGWHQLPLGRLASKYNCIK